MRGVIFSATIFRNAREATVVPEKVDRADWIIPSRSSVRGDRSIDRKKVASRIIIAQQVFSANLEPCIRFSPFVSHSRLRPAFASLLRIDRSRNVAAMKFQSRPSRGKRDVRRRDRTRYAIISLRETRFLYLSTICLFLRFARIDRPIRVFYNETRPFRP